MAQAWALSWRVEAANVAHPNLHPGDATTSEQGRFARSPNARCHDPCDQPDPADVATLFELYDHKLAVLGLALELVDAG